MLLVSSDEVEKRIADGQYVKGVRLIQRTKYDGEPYTTTEEGIWGICSACAREDRAKTDLRGAGALEQAKRIQNRLAFIRERRPELTLKQAAHAAVEDEFDPHNEPNPAFRAWLLERADRDTTRDAEIAATFGDGPHAGGAA